MDNFSFFNIKKLFGLVDIFQSPRTEIIDFPSSPQSPPNIPAFFYIPLPKHIDIAYERYRRGEEKGRRRGRGRNGFIILGEEGEGEGEIIYLNSHFENFKQEYEISPLFTDYLDVDIEIVKKNLTVLTSSTRIYISLPRGREGESGGREDIIFTSSSSCLKEIYGHLNYKIIERRGSVYLKNFSISFYDDFGEEL